MIVSAPGLARAWAMLALILAASLALSSVHVIDGDTLRAGGERYRLAGIDAPEIGAHARCDAERRAGEAAAAFARRRVAAADVIEARPAFQPRDRRRSWPRDRYGRRLAFIALDGEDLGRALIRAHLAAPWRYGRPRRDWCANPVAIR